MAEFHRNGPPIGLEVEDLDQLDVGEHAAMLAFEVRAQAYEWLDEASQPLSEISPLSERDILTGAYAGYYSKYSGEDLPHDLAMEMVSTPPEEDMGFLIGVPTVKIEAPDIDEVLRRHIHRLEMFAKARKINELLEPIQMWANGEPVEVYPPDLVDFKSSVQVVYRYRWETLIRIKGLRRIIDLEDEEKIDTLTQAHINAGLQGVSHWDFTNGGRPVPAVAEIVTEVLGEIDAYLEQYPSRGEWPDCQWVEGPHHRNAKRKLFQWLDKLPYDRSILEDLMDNRVYSWRRENPIGFETKALSGTVAHQMRARLRNLRMETPVTWNDNKPISIRVMADNLRTNSANLSRVETGKNAKLYPLWVEQYAEKINIPEVAFYPSDTPDDDDHASEALELNRRRVEERESWFREELFQRERLLEETSLNAFEMQEEIAALKKDVQDRERLILDNDKLRRSVAEMEVLVERHNGKPVKHNHPVLGKVKAGTYDDIILVNDPIEYIGTPPNLSEVANAFSVICAGDSVSPAYENGDYVHVHPYKPCRRGHFVVVQYREGNEVQAQIGRYIRVTGKEVHIEKLNPPEERVIKFEKIYKVVGKTNPDD